MKRSDIYKTQPTAKGEGMELDVNLAEAASSFIPEVKKAQQLLSASRLLARTLPRRLQAHWLALDVLSTVAASNAEWLSIKALYADVSASQPTVRKYVTHLAAGKLLEIRRCNGDMRKQEIRITPHGWRVIASIWDQLHPYE